jgi:hypothetical protein
MKNVDLSGFLQTLEGYGIEPKLGIIIVIASILALALVLALGIVYLLRQNAASNATANKNLKTPPSLKQVEFPSGPAARGATRREDIAATDNTRGEKARAVEVPMRDSLKEPQPIQKPAIVEAVAVKSSTAAAQKRIHAIPQDSVLRRHYLTHVRYMVESVSMPRPTESVLRRHYEQLVSSQAEACLDDDAAMERLLNRYGEHRRNIAQQQKRAVC